MKTHLSLEQAASLAVEGLSPLGSEQTDRSAALGRTLAEDLAAPMDQPPFDRAALDGYALRAADTAGAGRDHPVQLSVVDTVYAGDIAQIPVGPGQAARVTAGAMIPAGADCVVRQEETVWGKASVPVYQRAIPCDNFCPQGEEFKAGNRLLAAGTQIDAAAIGVLASAGICHIPVLRRPSVRLLCVGDGVVYPENRCLPEGKIYASSGELLLARLTELGISQASYRLIAAHPAAVAEAIRLGANSCDFVMTAGGVSAGMKNVLYEALSLLGADPVFGRVAVQPGGSALFSRISGRPVLSLSGDPLAAAVLFERLGRPVLAALSGEDFTPRQGEAILDGAFEPAGGVRCLIHGRYIGGHIKFPEGYPRLCSLIGCNCLADLPADCGPLEPGQRISVSFL